MPSPFPGMDPYLEGEMWQEFHERLAHQFSAQLMPLLSPRYVALLGMPLVNTVTRAGPKGKPFTGTEVKLVSDQLSTGSAGKRTRSPSGVRTSVTVTRGWAFPGCVGHVHWTNSRCC